LINQKNFRDFLPRFTTTFGAILLLLISNHAWAADVGGGGASVTLGGMFCNAYANTKPFGTLFSWMSYAAGVFCAIQATHTFMKHSEGPNPNHTLKGGLGLAGGAAALMALPGVAYTIVQSLVTQGGSGLQSCDPSGGGGGGGGLDQMLAGFVSNIHQPLLSLVSIIAIVCGIWMLVKGTMKASKYGIDPKAHSIHHITVNLVFGAILLTIGTSLTTVLSSVFGSSAITEVSPSLVLGWGFVQSLGGGSTQFANAVSAALIFFQLIGAIAFVRGWLIMKKVVEGTGNNTMGQGITHIVGGTLAINIAAFLQIMDTTFGTNLL
jgi:hypothetical protein